MNSLLYALLEISTVFTLLYLFYIFFLSRLTFHSLNRAVLLSIVFASVLIPFMRIGNLPLLQENLPIPDFTAEFITTAGGESQNEHGYSWPGPVTFVAWVYLMGVAVFLFRLVSSALKLILFIERERSANHHKTIFTTNFPDAFSCFRYIFLPEGLSEKSRELIIRHEEMHAKYYHTLDLILVELFTAFLWFHPFVYFFRKSVRAVHEFQVDQHMVKNAVSQKAYLQLLMKNLEIYRQPVGFYNYFYGITLKKRLKMMLHNKSHKGLKFRYLLLLPLAGILIMSFGIRHTDKPDYFPLKKGSYEKITSTHGEVFKNPITQKVVTHKGLDLKAPEGTTVSAAGSGKVLKATLKEGWGNLIVIDHGNGYETWYAHLQGFDVAEGERVTRGQKIARVGNTGYSTGPHLHFEVRLNGESIDPFEVVEQQ